MNQIVISAVSCHVPRMSRVSRVPRALPLNQSLPPASLVCTKRQPYWPKLRSSQEGRRGSQVNASRCKSNTITAKIIGLGEKQIASDMELRFALCNVQHPAAAARQEKPRENVDWWAEEAENEEDAIKKHK